MMALELIEKGIFMQDYTDRMREGLRDNWPGVIAGSVVGVALAMSAPTAPLTVSLSPSADNGASPTEKMVVSSDLAKKSLCAGIAVNVVALATRKPKLALGMLGASIAAAAVNSWGHKVKISVDGLAAGY